MTLFINGSFLERRMCGVRRFAENVTIELAKSGADVTLLAPAGLGKLCEGHIRVAPVGNSRGSFWEQVELPQYLNKIGTPKLLSLTNNCPVYYRNNVPTLHDLVFLAHPRSFPRFRLPLYRAAAARIVRGAKHIITVSEFSRKEIAAYYNVAPENISVAYNASSFPRRHDSIHEPNHYVEPYLLSFHSECEYKNMAFLLRVFNQLKKDRLHLKLVGGRAGISGNVHTLGRVTDSELQRLYSNAVALVFPSLYEGFGLPPLEAQSLECPVAAARIPALLEVLGNGALFFDPRDESGALTALSELQTNLATRNKLIVEGAANAARFSWQRTARRIRDVTEV